MPAPELPDHILELRERLAEHVHALWMNQRISEGWTYGPHRDDAMKLHPNIVPYDRLTDAEREYDRATALGTLQFVLSLGYRIEPPAQRRSRLKRT